MMADAASAAGVIKKVIKMEAGTPVGGAGAVSGAAGAASAAGSMMGAPSMMPAFAPNWGDDSTRLQQQQGVVPLQQGVVPFGLPPVPYTDLALAQMTRRSSPNMLPLAGMNPFAGGAMAHSMLTHQQQTLAPRFPPTPSQNETHTTPATAGGRTGHGQRPRHPGSSLPPHGGFGGGVAGSGIGGVVGGGGGGSGGGGMAMRGYGHGMPYGMTAGMGMGTMGPGGGAWPGLGGGGGGSAAGHTHPPGEGGGDVGAAYKRRVYQMQQMQRMQQLQLMRQQMQQQEMMRRMVRQVGGGMQQPGLQVGQVPTGQRGGGGGGGIANGVYTGQGVVGEGMGRRGGASPQQTAEHNNMVAATNMAEALQAMHGGSLRYD